MERNIFFQNISVMLKPQKIQNHSHTPALRLREIKRIEMIISFDKNLALETELITKSGCFAIYFVKTAH